MNWKHLTVIEEGHIWFITAKFGKKTASSFEEISLEAIVNDAHPTITIALHDAHVNKSDVKIYIDHEKGSKKHHHPEMGN